MCDKLMVILQVTDKSFLWSCLIYDRCQKDHSIGIATSQLNGNQTFVGPVIHHRYFKVYIYEYVTVHRNRFLFK